jgi:cytochrome c
MKKTLIALTLLVVMASCGNNENKGADTTAAGGDAASGTGAAAQTVEDVSTHPDYKKGLALIGQSDCLGCHKVSEKMTGPAYQEVAERYAGKPGIEDSLASKIINGGSGNWGDQMMTPHPNLSKEDAVSMVKYILLLKDQK